MQMKWLLLASVFHQQLLLAGKKEQFCRNIIIVDQALMFRVCRSYVTSDLFSDWLFAAIEEECCVCTCT